MNHPPRADIVTHRPPHDRLLGPRSTHVVLEYSDLGPVRSVEVKTINGQLVLHLSLVVGSVAQREVIDEPAPSEGADDGATVI